MESPGYSIEKNLQSESGNMKRLHDNVQSTNYKCKVCEKSSTTLGSLMRHIKTVHEGQRNHKCDSCGKCFSESGTLKRHIKTVHEGQSNEL